ncbi:MAG: hypothetical protein ACRELF_17860, partial [Gemmataceae bacterium]
LWIAPPPRPTAAAAALRNEPHDTTSEEPVPSPAFDPARLPREEDVHRPGDIVRVLLDLYVPGDIRPAARKKLTVFVAEGKPFGHALDHRVREAVHAILTMAEYQLA